MAKVQDILKLRQTKQSLSRNLKEIDLHNLLNKQNQPSCTLRQTLPRRAHPDPHLPRGGAAELRKEGRVSISGVNFQRQFGEEQANTDFFSMEERSKDVCKP